MSEPEASPSANFPDVSPARSPSHHSRHAVGLGAAGRSPERRQLFARDDRLGLDAPLVYIEVGQADALRPDCHTGHLICPIPGCPDPRYTSRGGLRRDHFAHLRAPTDTLHAPESYFHLVGKRLIGDWLRAYDPEARVIVDEEAVDNGQRPDVLATFPDARRFAFEIQYSALTLAAWTRRHKGYQAQGISDVWLFGHIPPHLAAAPGEHEPPRFALSALQLDLSTRGHQVYWINPDELAIHTPVQETAYWSNYGRRYVELTSDPIVDCQIEGTSFLTPTDVLARAEKARRQSAAAAAAAKVAAELARLEAQRKEQEAQQRERERQIAEWKANKAERKAAVWKQERPKIVERFGYVPPIIEEAVFCENLIFKYHPAYWRYLLFIDLIQGQVGKTFTFRRAIAPFVADQPGYKSLVSKAIGAYLFRLRDLGYLAFANDGYWVDDPITVLRDLHKSPAR